MNSGQKGSLDGQAVATSDPQLDLPFPARPHAESPSPLLPRGRRRGRRDRVPEVTPRLSPPRALLLGGEGHTSSEGHVMFSFPLRP